MRRWLAQLPEAILRGLTSIAVEAGERAQRAAARRLLRRLSS
jgi:hypothetical protein